MRNFAQQAAGDGYMLENIGMTPGCERRAPWGGALHADADSTQADTTSSAARGWEPRDRQPAGGRGPWEQPPAPTKVTRTRACVCLILHTPCVEWDTLCINSHTGTDLDADWRICKSASCTVAPTGRFNLHGLSAAGR